MADKRQEGSNKDPQADKDAKSKAWYGPLGALLGLLWRLYSARTGRKTLGELPHPVDDGKTPKETVTDWKKAVKDNDWANSLDRYKNKFTAHLASAQHLTGVM